MAVIPDVIQHKSVALNLAPHQRQKIDQEGVTVVHSRWEAGPRRIARAEPSPFQPLDGRLVQGGVYREVIMPNDDQGEPLFH